MKKILIFEKSKAQMNYLGDMFMDMLDTGIDAIYRRPHEIIIRTKTYEIEIRYIFSEADAFHSQIRGKKADYVINNTQNPSIDELFRYEHVRI